MNQSLFDEGIQYCILDGARLGQSIEQLKEHHATCVSLYRGQSEQAMHDVAPYLVRLQPRSSLNRWLFENGWGNSWGIFIRSDALIQDLRKHFRKFLLVQSEDGEELYFRFYDPRVLRVYLPTCTSAELTEFFGPVQKYIVEGDDPSSAMRFSLLGNTLKCERLDLSESPLPPSAPQEKVAVPPPVKDEVEESTIV